MKGKLYDKINSFSFKNGKFEFTTESGRYRIFKLFEKEDKYYMIEKSSARLDITLTIFKDDSKIHSIIEDSILEDIKNVY